MSRPDGISGEMLATVVTRSRHNLHPALQGIVDLLLVSASSASNHEYQSKPTDPVQTLRSYMILPNPFPPGVILDTLGLQTSERLEIKPNAPIASYRRLTQKMRSQPPDQPKDAQLNSLVEGDHGDSAYHLWKTWKTAPVTDELAASRCCVGGQATY